MIQKKRHFRRILSMLITLALFLTVVPLSAVAAPGEEPWNIQLFNDPIIKDANGKPFDKGNPWWYADPEIHRFDGKFWIYATRSAPYERQLNQDCFSSDDLITWTKHDGYIDEASLPDSWRSYWAPTVAYKDGYYYVLFGTNDLNLGSATAEYSTGDVSGMYLLRSEKPEGPFKQFMGKNVPLIPDNFFGAQAIDANMFLDEDNTMYLVYGGWSQCLMAKFKDDMTGFVPLTRQERAWRDGSTPQAAVNHFIDYFLPLTPVGGTAIAGDLNYQPSFLGTNETYVEGPIIYKIDGLYYLLYSVGGWTTDTYGLRYGISRNPLGPYTMIPGRMLQTRYSASARGAGHHSMVYIEENDMWLNCYHRRPIGGGTNDRYTALDIMHTYEGQITFVGESTQTRVKLFEPTIPTAYWSSLNPLPRNLAGYVQNTQKIGVRPSYSASGQSGNSAQPGHAFDAGINTSSYWQSAGATAGQWLRIDFGESKTYNEIHLYFNQLGTANSSIATGTRIQLQSSDNGTDWTDIMPARTLSAAERTRRDGSYYFVRQALTTPVTSRYLRLYSPDAVTVGVHEFEVYNIESVNQLAALQNAGAKIQEVNPGTIPASALVAPASAVIEAPAPVQAASAPVAPADFAPAMEDNFEGAPVLALADAIGDPINSMAVVPGSGMRGSTDPWVVFDDGYYYYVRAENETSVTVSKTQRLEDIGKAKKVTVWAPDYDEFPLLRAPRLHKIGDKWYLYVSASDGDDHRLDRNTPSNLWSENHVYNIYALEADNPLGPFEMKGMITKPDQWAADGTVLQHPNGKDYFVWSGKMGEEPEDPNAPAKLVKVSSSTTNPLDQGVVGMFDNNTATKLYTDGAFVYGANQAPNGGLNVDMEYSKPLTINRFRIGTANDSNGRDPAACTIRGSHDGVNWDPPFYTTSNLNLSTTRQVFQTFNLSASVTYQYYRWNITSVRTSGQGFQVSEFNLMTPDGDMPFLTVSTPKQALYIQEMADPLTLVGERSMISEPTLSWEQVTLNNVPMAINEGPAATVRGNDIYIFYSGNAGTGVNSGIGMLRAVAGSNPLLMASWTKSANSVFRGGTSTTVGTAGVYYVRQPSLVKSPDGTEDWLLYQAGARSYGNAAPNSTNATAIRQFLNSKKDRSVRMQKIVFNASGAPSFDVTTSGTATNAGNAAMTAQTFLQPSGSNNADIYIMQAEDAVLTGVMNTNKNAAAGDAISGLRATTGITNAWMRGGRQNQANAAQGSASGGWGDYWNASGGLAVRLGQNGAAKFEFEVDSAGLYDLTVMGIALEYDAKQIIDVNGTSYEMVHTLYSQRYGGLFTPQSVTVALEEGNNTITVTNKAGSVGAVIDYLYISKPQPVIPVLVGSSMNIPIGETVNILTGINPAYAYDKTLVWTTSNPAVATVADGVVTTVGIGSALITATSVTGHTAQCLVSTAYELKSILPGNTIWILVPPEGDGFRSEFVYINAGANPLSVILYVAGYNTAGKLVKLESDEALIGGGASQKLSAIIEDSSGITSFKFFIWDGDYIPLSADSEFEF